MPRNTLLIIALLLPAAPCHAEDLAALLETAVGGVHWTFPDDVAYTETIDNNDGVLTARYDPSQDPEQPWTLLSVDGRTPTAEEIDAFLEDKAASKRHEDSDEDDDAENELTAMLDADTLTLLEDEDDHWLIGFTPTSSEKKSERFLKSMVGTVQISKPDKRLRYFDIRNRGVVKPAFGVKIRDFLTRFDFDQVLADGPVMLTGYEMRIEGRAYVAVNLNEQETRRFSDFERIDE